MPGQVFTALGERLTRALLDGDFPAYASVMALPLTITPRGDVAYVLHNADELRADFQLYHDNLKGRGVTDIFRQINEIAVIDQSHLRVRCTIHIMVGAQRIVEPFVSHFVLTETPDGWRIAEIESVRGHIRFSLGLSEITGGAFTPVSAAEGESDDET
ncbi:hypothetical protein [Cypionkella sinensis]|uniref:SnoaL-like domain-containing protein n=1 Tax=Cypionkella sinensis TaxID=1756043 RepID=A0ABV7IYA7_9RHOB